MQTIHINTGKPYDVHIGAGILAQSGKMIRALSLPRCTRVAVISDDTVAALYGGAVRASLEQAGYQVLEYTFPHGEASKNMQVAMDAVGFLCEHSLTRSDLIVALGGGVVGDLAGFVASVYQRGIDYVQIPTTFLAAIDSSVGGKTAVNIPQGKNLLGAFWQPRLVICDTETLLTLTDEIWGDGIAEAIKYGCIWDESLFQVLAEGRLQENLAEVIARCVGIKADVVAQDEHDNGLRQILNFGHTIGHAVEKLSAFSISHGRGVAIGMCLVAAAGESGGLTTTGTTARIRAALERYSLPITCSYGLEELCNACRGDKKRGGDSINLIVLDRIGKCTIHPVEVDELADFFKE